MHEYANSRCPFCRSPDSVGSRAKATYLSLNGDFIFKTIATAVRLWALIRV